MIEGLYQTTFHGPAGTGYGVVALREGRVEGGDSAIFYRGAYKVEGDRFEADVQTGRHAPGLPSVLGVDAAPIKLVGTIQGSRITAQGTTPLAPSAKLAGQLTLIS